MEEYYLTNQKHDIIHIQLKDAKNVLLRGLKYYIGDNAQWLDKYDEVADWLADNKCRGLLFSGDNGLGKTVICAKIIPAIFKYYLKAEYFSVNAVKLGECYRNDLDHYNLVYSCDPIIIDDVGVESIVSDYGEKHDLFSEVVDDAEKKGRLMIITTNLSTDELSERYGRRTVDRLKAITRAIRIDGDSLRG
mgnify:CR=1 FL=1